MRLRLRLRLTIATVILTKGRSFRMRKRGSAENDLDVGGAVTLEQSSSRLPKGATKS